MHETRTHAVTCSSLCTKLARTTLRAAAYARNSHSRPYVRSTMHETRTHAVTCSSLCTKLARKCTKLAAARRHYVNTLHRVSWCVTGATVAVSLPAVSVWSRCSRNCFQLDGVKTEGLTGPSSGASASEYNHVVEVTTKITMT
jgi:hypothetical protein